MEMVKIGNYMVVYQRQGNDKNGNPIFLVNVFYTNPEIGTYYNVNHLTNKRLDKYGNIRLQSYNIVSDIDFLIKKSY